MDGRMDTYSHVYLLTHLHIYFHMILRLFVHRNFIIPKLPVFHNFDNASDTSNLYCPCNLRINLCWGNMQQRQP